MADTAYVRTHWWQFLIMSRPRPFSQCKHCSGSYWRQKCISKMVSSSIVPGPRGAGEQSWPWTAAPASPAGLEDAPLGLSSVRAWGSSPSKRGHSCSVHLLETGAPWRYNQSGPRSTFGKPETTLLYEPSLGGETAPAFGLGSWRRYRAVPVPGAPHAI